MRYLYSLVLYFSIPIILLMLLFRGFREREYWLRIPERFGFRLGLCPDEKPLISIHAVSVGEVNTTKPIVAHLLEHYPNYSILITTMTPGGSVTVRQNYDNRVIHCYLPYDFPGAIKRFIRHARPQLQIITETGIWPNFFHALKKHGAPVLLVSARLSKKSLRRYSRFGRLTRSTLSMLDKITAQTDDDAGRLISLGMSADKIEVTGNLKYSIPLPQSVIEQGQSLRATLSAGRPVWIAASTHEGEEKIILDLHRKIRLSMENCLLLIAPRHIGRTEKIIALCVKNNLGYVKRTNANLYSDTTAVYILNTLGELGVYYAAADVAFVGGSLVRRGGHNILEPVSIGVPTITGPYTYNFSEINEQLQEIGVVLRVVNAEELLEGVTRFLLDQDLRYTTGKKGMNYIRREQKKNANKVLSIIEPYLKRESTV